MKNYVDLYLVPLRKKHLRAYCRMSLNMGKIWRKYGALEYREFMGDDLKFKGMITFSKRVSLKPGEVVVAAAVGYRSKAHRNQINKKVMADPRVLRMAERMMKNPMFDVKRMSFGGFTTIVQA